MKKVKIIALCLFFIISVVFLTENTSKCESGIYLALGDSISTGYGLEDAQRDSFTSLVAENCSYSLENHAKDGSTADDVLKLLESKALDEKIRNAKLITITCGGNDMLRVLYKECAEAFNAVSGETVQKNEIIGILSDTKDARNKQMMVCAWDVLLGNGADIVPFAENEEFKEALKIYGAQLESIIKYIREINSDAEIIIPTQFNPYKMFSGFLSVINKGIGSAVTELNEIIMENGTTLGYTVADVYTAFENETASLCNADAETMNLDFHPNSDGHALIAKCITDALGKNTAFTDVANDNPFFEAINFVRDNNLFNGVTETEFAPDLSMTRAMIVTVLYRAEGEPQCGGSGFSDISKDSYYHDAVIWAKENGIVNGYSETEFAPDDSIKREQLAAIMLRYAKHKGNGPVGAWAIRLDYTDLSEISDYAAEAVMYCTMKGMMRAKTDKEFMPKSDATRAEVALAMQKFMQRNE